jgi:hypothetical protein
MAALAGVTRMKPLWLSCAKWLASWYNSEEIMQETKVLNGVYESLKGLRKVVEALPDNNENVDLWAAIGEAEVIAEGITKR